MVLTLLILALFFFGLTVWFFSKNKKALAVTFGLIGLMALALYIIVRAMYPHKVPF
jgi:hypothetical protein